MSHVFSFFVFKVSDIIPIKYTFTQLITDFFSLDVYIHFNGSLTGDYFYQNFKPEKERRKNINKSREKTLKTFTQM